MQFYKDYVYPQLVSKLGNPKPIQDIRQRIIPLAQGVVLEIGAGSGANFVHYDPASVSKLYALEPNPGMIRLATRELRKTKLDVGFLDLPGERIPLPNGAVDTVVSTFTLCTIPRLTEALQGIRRVLKPGGKFLFFEMGRSPDPQVRRSQERWEPVFHRLFEGLFLTREIPEFILANGFQIAQMETAYLAKFPKSLTYCWWGTAISTP